MVAIVLVLIVQQQATPYLAIPAAVIIAENNYCLAARMDGRNRPARKGQGISIG